ncbi:PREDICTED: taste receptor type 2 member 3-like [Gekko japonicus]|uniref:Taste receptor type 2 n=1 Tax=Gekko japonicus TaxID=146911 RepID=A0ABM1LDJ5_GEKJA|nr:PREDICTED: taste receptor type 2 member 3-like [Gekko japonicus]
MEVSAFVIISSILLVIETLVGLVANGFIALMNYIDWFRSRKLSPNDQILTCLALSRLMWLAAVILNITAHYYSMDKHNCHYVYLMLPILWIFTNTSSTLFATCLSVFYLTKIATFSHPVFLQVKLRFSGLVPWLLPSSVLLSAFTAIFLVTGLSNGFSMCDSNKSLLNITDSGIKLPDLYMYIDILATVPNLIPLMIFLSSSILLLTSLWMHRRRMQRNGTGIQDLNTQVHLTAIKALASFAVLYLSSFLAVIAQAVLIWNDMSGTWLFMLLSNVTVSSPSGHAVILILLNPTLKQAWIRMLLHLKCCSSEVPS